MVPRLVNAPRVTSEIHDASDVHLLTGGLGGLGLVTARWLASQGAAAIVLASRSGQLSKSGASEWSCLQASQTAVCLQRCDVANGAAMRRLICSAAGSGRSRVCGVWHSAGVLADALLAQQSEEGLLRVLTPKVCGAQSLQSAFAAGALCSCVFFSSAAALLGGAGQANYCAANAGLDARVTARRAEGVVGTSVQWGPWADVGMAASSVVVTRMHASGVGLIRPAAGMAALQRALQSRGAAVVSVRKARDRTRTLLASIRIDATVCFQLKLN